MARWFELLQFDVVAPSLCGYGFSEPPISEPVRCLDLCGYVSLLLLSPVGLTKYPHSKPKRRFYHYVELLT